MPQIVTAIFDLGKTNKKFLLFDPAGVLVYSRSGNLKESRDEDGFPCEDLVLLREWMLECWKDIQEEADFEVRSLNFSAYGASLVYLDSRDRQTGPLYSYLKPLAPEWKEQICRTHGDSEDLAWATSSPSLDFLNSGMQLYWIKYARPELFHRIHTALHLPQYASWLFTARPANELSSLGCHTMLWDFHTRDYASWVKQEGLDRLFPSLTPGPWNGRTAYRSGSIPVGKGVHDSSAALIHYLKDMSPPFAILSSGTWGICLNPFSKQVLSRELLRKDCLQYISPQGSPVLASRFFLGHHHDEGCRLIARHFNVPLNFASEISPDFEPRILPLTTLENPSASFPGSWSAPYLYRDEQESYYFLLYWLARQQARQIALICGPEIRTLEISGGFSRNKLFLSLLGQTLPGWQFHSGEVPEASARGAALILDTQQYP